jgi:hypothetical protein
MSSKKKSNSCSAKNTSSVDKSLFSNSKRDTIKTRTENLKSKKLYKGVLRILSETDSPFDISPSGVSINFSTLDDNALVLIEEYLDDVAPIPKSFALPAYDSNSVVEPAGTTKKMSTIVRNFMKNMDDESNSILHSDTKTGSEKKKKIIVKPFTFK